MVPQTFGFGSSSVLPVLPTFIMSGGITVNGITCGVLEMIPLQDRLKSEVQYLQKHG